MFWLLFFLTFGDGKFHFIAAPVHQMQQYYRLGTLDNCGGKWSALVDCLTLKTKSRAEAQVCFLKTFVYSTSCMVASSISAY